ncbi:MAG: mechanosensitive ion channel protein MscS [Bacteroidetes bacterium GWC2_33_15]|nr:MAG: mechanosensitive ion channel protein MscS [Bacteroidetes bacterium GWA2_33_15]OFX50406.1 MAG: mechanosensitive ion channel protein MscS [Bacteroidetes bacterium GWC2_33_15]OFX66676.1 MAG: mechanosensitive ion channel protein MscS [Bacteroidetes bacterium GWB2_32_14]OFX69294.1 MAG: mechanosensitive ion channel protein MscS [Bacteroidetes bacterium GWD2_33_33]HAN18609.1 mechanosensitive ion channel protein MscS [Bacteroidales bacterium]
MNLNIGTKIQDWLIHFGFTQEYAFYAKTGIEVILIFLVSLIAFFITKKVLVNIIHNFAKKSKSEWDDILLNRQLLNRLSHLVPAVIIYAFAKNGLEEFPNWSKIILSGINIYMIFIGMLIVNAFLNALHEVYLTMPSSKDRPIKGYLQTVSIFVFFIGSIFIISIILGKSPYKLLASLGAIAAILLLVFKDSILGLVSGIQLSANQMVKIGDWITMPSRNADGDVLEITLNTVKVQNFDKTIVTIPTYALMSESFQNWKGMEDSKGRRIARSVYIDLKSITFCNHEMLEKFKKINLIKDYIIENQTKIDEYNKALGIDESDRLSGRNITNIEVFRKYCEIYLDNHPKIHSLNSPYTLLVRHLQPTEKGLPVQIYVFCKEVSFVKFELVQAEIFDHILAVIPEFGLSIFQSPSSEDIRSLNLSNLQ